MTQTVSKETFEPTPHPLLPLPDKEEVVRFLSVPGGAETLAQWYAKREKLISDSEEDPYHHGFVLDWWRECDSILEDYLLLVIFGGNGSAKTWYGAWHGVRTLIEYQRCEVLFLHDNDTSSILVQQKPVFRFLPLEWKRDSKRRNAEIGYDPKNGFRGNRFVTPGGSVAQFGNYNQDVGAYEGTAWKLIVADENLPLPWLKTLLYRLPRARGKMIWTYTPIIGLTKAIKHVVDGARTVQYRRAHLLPASHKAFDDCKPGHMPVEQECLDPLVRVRYIFTEENPFEDYEKFSRIMQRESLEIIERRGYGYARTTKGTLFPKFGAVNLVNPDKIPIEEITRYHIADPHGNRPVFMLWVSVDRDGRHFVYREWPDMDRYGEWATESLNPSRFDGDVGPAQQPNGFSVERYKRQILLEEGNRWVDGKWVLKSQEKIFRRYGDPRALRDQAVVEESGGTSFVERMYQVQIDEKGTVIGPSLDFIQAPGLKIDIGIQAINDLLSYDSGREICAKINEPKLYISRNCRNLIWALQNWTGRDGEKGAAKDPIDCLRYMATAKLFYVDPETWRPRGGGSY